MFRFLRGSKAPAARLSLPVPVTEYPDEILLHSPVPVWTRTYVVSAWPEEAADIWARVLSVPAVTNVRLIVTPSGFRWSLDVQKRLRRLISSVQEQRRDRTQAPRPEEVLAVRAIESLRDALLYEGLQASDVWALVTVLSDSREHLDAEASAVLAALSERGVEVEPVRFDQVLGFAATLPVGDTLATGLTRWPHRTGVVRAVARVVPEDLQGFAGDERGVYVGHTARNHVPVFLDLRQEDTELNASCVVVGASGEGKSFWQKAVGVVGALLDGWWVLVFDVDGEYRRVCEQVGGLWVDLSGASGRYPDVCRFADPSGDPLEDAGRYGRLFAAIATTFGVILGEENAVAPAERTVVEQEIQGALLAAGVARRDSATWDNARLASAGFSLSSVYERIRARAGRGDPWAVPVAQKLWRYFEGSMSDIFEDPLPMSSMPNRLVVLHLGNPRTSAVDAGALGVKYQLAMGVAWEWLRQNRALGRWTNIVVDEGQRAMAHPILAANFAELASTVRKWNGNLFLATNDPKSLWASGHGTTLWDNSQFKIVFWLEEDRIRDLSSRANIPEGVAAAITRQFGKRFGMLRVGSRGWVQVRLSLPDEERGLYRTRRGLERDAAAAYGVGGRDAAVAGNG